VGCSAYHDTAPRLEMLDVKGLATTPAAGNGGTSRHSGGKEGDSPPVLGEHLLHSLV